MKQTSRAFICRQCLAASRRPSAATRGLATSSPRRPAARATTQPPEPSSSDNDPNVTPSKATAPKDEEDLGPMARRLADATEDALLTGGRAGRQAVEDAGFSDELKARLLDKIADAQFRTDHAAAFAAAGISSSAVVGEGTRAAAAAQPWTGDEPVEDAVLRMLDDARRPLRPDLRGKAKIPSPGPIDLRLRREPAMSPGLKAATARDRAAAYAGLGLKEREERGLSDKEREAMSREFKDRFSPGYRGAMPNSVTGLAALANERIENAIARGQFKNIPRGKGVERDARADNPFIDTTEYILNKMIKRQDIAPPWIEKQQELVRAANTFRSRLRSDWRRHAARTISGRGGSLAEQVARAERYAAAEELHNPRSRTRGGVDQMAVPANATDDPVMLRLRRDVAAEMAAEMEELDVMPAQAGPHPPDMDTKHGQIEQDAQAAAAAATAPAGAPASPSDGPLPPPLRDPDWEATERSYMQLAIENLNALTRSYNLMAPDLAKKPYFSLDRELRACFADVAPQLAATVRERATRPARSLASAAGDGLSASVLDRVVGEMGPRARVYDSKAPHYGFKDFLRDLWSRK